MVMNRKAYVRTLEAGIAAFITFLFITIVLPQYAPISDRPVQPLLGVYENNPEFRNCAIEYNTSCVDSFIRQNVPSSEDFLLDVSENPTVARMNLPAKRINTESIFIQGNATEYAPRLIKVYLYKR
jgi:hypothetical protein